MVNYEDNEVIIETTNAKVLFENLTKFGFNFNNIDFDILECKILYSEGELLIEKDDFEPSNPLHNVEQVLKLKFFSIDNLIIYPIKLSSESKEMVRLYAEFMPFDYNFCYLAYDEIYDRLNAIIKKRKAKFGFIIADEYNSIDVFNELKPVIDNIMENNGVLTKKIRVPVSQTFLKIEPEPFVLDMKAEIGKNVVCDKNENSSDKKQESPDDEDKIFYIVTQDEIALVSKKGKNGTHGRDHYGKILPVSTTAPEDLKPLRLKFDARHIKEIENDGEYYYYALSNGYIYINHFKDYSEIVFKDTFETKTINKYKTGDVNLPNTTIKVSDSNNPKDLIYEASITSEKLDVTGSIGEHSIINACAIIVKGTTHLTSNIKGDNIDIKIHKGSIDGNIVNIKEVETGSLIRGNIIYIDRALGGTIMGNEIHIKECKNNNTIVAKKLIKIKNITGEHNKISIEHGVPEEEKIELEDLKKEMKSINFKLQSDNITLKKLLETIESQKAQKKELEEKIKGFADITKVPIGIVNNFKQIMGKIKEYNSLFTSYQETKEMKEKIISRIKELETAILKSYILIESSGHSNKYGFKILSDKVVDYKGTQEGKLYLTINADLDKIENSNAQILSAP